MKKPISLLLFFLFGCLSANAQLIETPLDYSLPVHAAWLQAAAQSPNQARMMPPNALKLPFLDDFSYEGAIPNPLLWADTNVYVNRGMGRYPPTTGVATFDGINKKGLPYNWSGASGVCDTLTSRRINLFGRTAADSIYLSFYLQAGGNGDKPESTDIFYVDFLNKNNVWTTVAQRSGLAATVIDTAFREIRVAIKATNYLDSTFRFRFRNVGSQRGARDNWNIDYVKLDKNRSWREPTFNDFAFYDQPSSPLVNYTAMPYTHFKATTPQIAMTDKVVFRLRNNFNAPKSPQITVQVTEQYGGATILPLQTPFFYPISKAKDTVAPKTIPLTSYNFGGLPAADSALLVVRYAYGNITGQDQFTNQPTYPLLNDTVTRLVQLRNYFAYDDGTAESNIVTQNVGTQAAVKFRTVIADTLQGILINIPVIDTDVSTQLFNFRVFTGSLTGTMVFEQTLMRPYYTNNIDGFAVYPFRNGTSPPPFIPANTDFFVVWQQASTTTPIPIGLDKNSPQGSQFIFQNTGTGGWQPIAANIKGAMMLRPYMGSKRLVATETLRDAPVAIALVPNPTDGVLNVQNWNGNAATATCYDLLGRVQFTSALRKTLDLTVLPSGVYFVRIAQEGVAPQTVKVVKQ